MPKKRKFHLKSIDALFQLQKPKLSDYIFIFLLMEVTSGFYFFGIFLSNRKIIFVNGKVVVVLSVFVTKFGEKQN